MRKLELVIDQYKFEVPVFSKDGKSWVALKQLCEALGVNPDTQRRKIECNPEISCGHMTSTGVDGKQYQMLCIEVDHVGIWLYGINPNKVSPEIREKMYAFRQKLVSVLYAAVTGNLDLNMVHALVNEVQLMKGIIQNQQLLLETQGKTIEYLLQKEALNENYVDKRLSSIGGKMLSSMAHKKRKSPQVA